MVVVIKIWHWCYRRIQCDAKSSVRCSEQDFLDLVLNGNESLQEFTKKSLLQQAAPKKDRKKERKKEKESWVF